MASPTRNILNRALTYEIHIEHDHSMKNIMRSIWAILAAFLFVVICSTLTDFILEQMSIFPMQGLFVTWMLVVALIYRCIYTIGSGYIVARLAPKNPKKHIIILGILGTIAGILGVVAGWNLSSHWYPIAIAITAFPCIWLGGSFFKKSKKK